jgi:hypothetical protein
MAGSGQSFPYSRLPKRDTTANISRETTDSAKARIHVPEAAARDTYARILNSSNRKVAIDRAVLNILSLGRAALGMEK